VKLVAVPSPYQLVSGVPPCAFAYSGSAAASSATTIIKPKALINFLVLILFSPQKYLFVKKSNEKSALPAVSPKEKDQATLRIAAEETFPTAGRLPRRLG
jgi:hypothetical protein